MIFRGIYFFSYANSKLRSQQQFYSMGPVRSFIQDMDKADEQKNAAKQAVKIAVKMLEQKFKNFEDQLNIPVGEVSKMPARYLVCTKKNIGIKLQKNPKNITDGISQIVSSFSSGNVAKGIENILKTSLDALLGSYSGGYNESQDYMVVTNLLGGIYRIDYLVIQQKMEATSIKKYCQDVFGSYLIISSINKAEITDDNVYRVLVDRQFSSRKMKDKLTLLKMVKGQDLTEAEMTDIHDWKYDDSDKVTPPPPPPPPSQMTQQSFLNQQQLFEQEWKERQICIKIKADIEKEAQILAELQQKVEETRLKIIKKQLELAHAEEQIANMKRDAELQLKQSEIRRLREQIQGARKVHE